MKNTLVKSCLALSIGLAGTAQAGLVTGWVQIIDVQTPSTGITGANTGSPIMGDADGATLAANFPSVTLADGESLTLTGSVAFDVALQSTQFRWGLFDGDNPPTVGDGAGYVGLLSSAADDSSPSAGVGFGDGTSTNPFASAATTSLGLLPASSGSVLPNETLDYTLTIARDGANLDVFASITDNNDFSQSLDLQDQALTQYTFDNVAFLIGGSMNGSVSTFTDIDVTYVPEPGSLALVVLGGLLAARRRR